MSKLLTSEQLERIRNFETPLGEEPALLSHIDALQEQVKQLTANLESWHKGGRVVELEKDRDRLAARCKALRTIAHAAVPVAASYRLLKLGFKPASIIEMEQALAADDAMEKSK